MLCAALPGFRRSIYPRTACRHRAVAPEVLPPPNLSSCSSRAFPPTASPATPTRPRTPANRWSSARSSGRTAQRPPTCRWPSSAAHRRRGAWHPEHRPADMILNDRLGAGAGHRAVWTRHAGRRPHRVEAGRVRFAEPPVLPLTRLPSESADKGLIQQASLPMVAPVSRSVSALDPSRQSAWGRLAGGEHPFGRRAGPHEGLGRCCPAHPNGC